MKYVTGIVILNFTDHYFLVKISIKKKINGKIKETNIKTEV